LKRIYSSKELRQCPKFLRNDFATASKWGIPFLKKCEVDITNIQLIGSDKIRTNDTSINILKTVHFFVEDNKLGKYYSHPEKYLPRLAQYAHILTPDFSLYTDMPMAIQVYNTFKSRWCGAYWQEHNLSVIPTVSWSTDDSFEFCFNGLEYGTIVAVSTVGGLKNKELFLRGYFEMKRRINPNRVLCFGRAFPEMGNEVITVDYLETTGRVK
jgi:hypothetical protein